MRSIRFSLALALLGLPSLAWAQSTDDQAKPPAKPAAVTTPPTDQTGAIKEGSVDFGVLGSSVTGDDSRYNRFRDLSNGPFIDNFRTRLEKNGWFLDFGADHVARQDARYSSTFVRPGTLTGWFQWDQIRELVSDNTKSLFTQVTPGVLRVDANVRNALQAAAGPPSTLSTVLPATLSNFALPFTLGTRRHIASGSAQYFIDPDTTLKLDASHTNRMGSILYSGTFGFGNAVDIPQPISQHTTNTNLTFEHQAGDALLRAGFTGSYFRNDDSLLTWDNPYRFTDLATLSSQGRTSVAPSNNWNAFNGSFSYALPAHSRFMAYAAFGFLDDNGQIMIPQTINTAIPALPLARNTVGGEGHTKNATISFVSRPNHRVSFDVRYRYYDYKNLTPIYSNTTGRVQYDSSLQVPTPTSPLATLTTDRFGGSKQTGSVDMHIVAVGGSSIGVGFVHNGATYNDRIFAGSGENAEHVSYDVLTTQYLSVHAKYEHAVRRGTGLDTTGLVEGGEQPTIRHFDIADRDRDLFTVAASIFPVSSLSITATAGDGQDKYPNSNFGLFNAKHYVYGVACDIDPNEHVNLNAGFNLDDFNSVQWSRTASPGPQAASPSRDWSDTGHDRTTNVTAGLNLLNLQDRVDVRFGYDYTRGRGSYIYGTSSAPLDPVVTSTLNPPVQLPNLSNDFTRGTVALVYKATSKLSVGLTYWYEQFKVSDLALDSAALPAFNLATNDILMGYQYLPYTAHSFFARVIYRW